ncbi:Sugar phosphate exchanger 3 [Liparis tanakae]|uniref:Sugar phosphate exchanger 3 n=1 Tax=Liparis tanakae TaxID=230148 RepID=A0A4Z2I2A6_9TELE|nr:Sugar phosphate exchanger 3 [Liparis tanakae]
MHCWHCEGQLGRLEEEPAPVMPPLCCGYLSQYTHHHLVAFLLTFFSYVLLHASRKTFSNVKVSISAQWTPSLQNGSVSAFSPGETWEDNHLFADEKQATLFLGALDSIFLFSYAMVGTRRDFPRGGFHVFVIRLTLPSTQGLYCSGVIGDRVNLRYVLCFGLCGSATVEFMFGTLTEWLQIYNVYLYCALWVVNGLLQSAVWPCVVAVMGNWFGKTGRGFVFGLWSACASVGNILGAFLASSYAFLVTSVAQFAGGVVVFFGLLTSPKEVGKDSKEHGLISDFMGKRAPVLVVTLLLAMGSLVGYSNSPNDQVINGALLAATGFCIGGPSNMISSAISADLGRQEALRGSQEALATVTGIVDGTGSIGAAFGQYLVSLIESKLGWTCVFYFFIVMTGGSIVFITPLLYNEVRAMWRDRQALRRQLWEESPDAVSHCHDGYGDLASPVVVYYRPCTHLQIRTSCCSLGNRRLGNRRLGNQRLLTTTTTTTDFWTPDAALEIKVPALFGHVQVPAEQPLEVALQLLVVHGAEEAPSHRLQLLDLGAPQA